jgi:hypothetical protein
MRMPTIFPANPAATDQVIMRKTMARIGSVDKCHCQPYQAVEATNPTPTNAAPILQPQLSTNRADSFAPMPPINVRGLSVRIIQELLSVSET